MDIYNCNAREKNSGLLNLKILQILRCIVWSSAIDSSHRHSTRKNSIRQIHSAHSTALDVKILFNKRPFCLQAYTRPPALRTLLQPIGNCEASDTLLRLSVACGNQCTAVAPSHCYPVQLKPSKCMTVIPAKHTAAGNIQSARVSRSIAASSNRSQRGGGVKRAKTKPQTCSITFFSAEHTSQFSSLPISS